MVRDGNRFIINIPGRGYSFVGLCNGIEAVVQIERRESKWRWQRQRLERKLHQDRALDGIWA